MKAAPVLFSMLKADFLERTRRSSFLVTLCLVITLGYAVNSGQVLIQLDHYRGVYNSAWVGGLMALVITFFLGIFGFYLVKNTIERDERTGVGQILATTALTRPQYLLGKWLSNFSVLGALVGILALAATLMQLLHHEEAQVQLWPLLAPFLFVALPMMALVAALAVLFETIRWLKGGFGNLVYMLLFVAIFMISVRLDGSPELDVTGFTLIGGSMRAAAQGAFPGYNGSFVLGMVEREKLDTFAWNGVDWIPGVIAWRLAWLAAAAGVALLGCVFFDRFEGKAALTPGPSPKYGRGEKGVRQRNGQGNEGIQAGEWLPAQGGVVEARLTPLAQGRRFHFNFLRLAWLEFLLLVKGLRWYWLVGMALIWAGCLAAPSDGYRKYGYMLAAIWPVLVWSGMGQREARYQAEQLIFPAAHPLARLLAPAWLAGALFSLGAESGVLLGRLAAGEPLRLLPWLLAALFIPALALALGVWSRSSKLFEVVYPILWYLGPFNVQNGLVGLDYLGIHAQAPVNTAPLLFGGGICGLLLLAWIGRRRQALPGRPFGGG